MSPRHVLPLFLLVALLMGQSEGGRHHHHNNHKLMELLTAGIVAKVLQKQEGDDGEGGHEYYPVPVHIPMHSQKHHHHITEKIIPIPIPHHTTRIIHINAGEHHSSPHHHSAGGDENGGGYDHGGSYTNSNSEGGYSSSHSDGGYSSSHGGGGGGYSNGHSGGYDSSEPGEGGPAQSIQQLFFQDTGIYAQPARPQMRHPAYLAYRRPTVGLVPAAAAHQAYLLRARMPYIAVRHRPHPIAYGTAPRPYRAPVPYGAAPVATAPYGAAPYGSPMYAFPYRRIPTAATYMNPMVVRRPYPQSVPPMPPVW